VGQPVTGMVVDVESAWLSLAHFRSLCVNFIILL